MFPTDPFPSHFTSSYPAFPTNSTQQTFPARLALTYTTPLHLAHTHVSERLGPAHHAATRPLDLAPEHRLPVEQDLDVARPAVRVDPGLVVVLQASPNSVSDSTHPRAT